MSTTTRQSSSKNISSNFQKIESDHQMKTQLKNIPAESVLSLADLVTYTPGQVVSKTLSKNDLVRITLFAFGKGEGLSTHSADGDALIQVLTGTAKITINGKDFTLRGGESIVMPAGAPHAVFAVETFKMLLTVVFDPES